MWVIASSVYSAILSFTDLWFFLYLALYLGADPLTLGLASSLWSLAFVASNALLGRFIEGGSNRLGALASSLLLCAATFITVSSSGVTEAVFAYSVLHAVSTSLGRVATNVTVLEYVNHEDWSRYNYFFSYVTLVARGLLLVLAYCGLMPPSRLLATIVAVSAVYSLTLPPIVIPVERTLFRLSKQLDRVYSYTRFTSILPEVVGSGLTAQRALELRWSAWRETPSYRPLLGIFILVASSDALFVMVPRLLSGYVGRQQTLLVYGISSLASALALAVVSRLSGGRAATLLSGLTRALMIPAVTLIAGVDQAVAYLLATAALFNIFNASCYNTYVNSSGGQRTFLFGIAAELGSAVGSAVGGYLFSCYDVTLVVALSVVGHIAASMIAS